VYELVQPELVNQINQVQYRLATDGQTDRHRTTAQAQRCAGTIRYENETLFNVRSKAGISQLNLAYRTERNTEKLKTEKKLKTKKTDMLRSIGKQSE